MPRSRIQGLFRLNRYNKRSGLEFQDCIEYTDRTRGLGVEFKECIDYTDRTRGLAQLNSEIEII